MGINRETAVALCYLRREGLVNSRILNLGRPKLYVGRRHLAQLNRSMSLGLSEPDLDAIVSAPYADEFLKRVGFDEISSLDASDYEGAEVVHDLNRPIPPELCGRFDCIYDGGTLEHVFDVASAFRNVIDLLSVGGVAVFAPPANSQCGHGFYQFSPELFYRTLRQNGFGQVIVYVTSIGSAMRWFRVADPEVAERRIQFMSAEPMQLVVIARKTQACEQFVIPMQSDYSEAWKAGSYREGGSRFGFVRRIGRDHIAYPTLIMLRHMTGLCLGSILPGLWRRSVYSRVDPFVDRLF